MTLLDQLNQENIKKNAPLAERMRARTLDEFYGQEHLLGPGRLLRRAVEADRLTSSIFYGPPGCGKTTLAHVIAAHTKSAFARMNAVTSGVGDVREVLEQAAQRRAMYGQSTYLLLDECHRWNKAQSDSILPAIEEGLIRFIGSTTENPMISMTPAIVSRCRVFELKRLSEENIMTALRRALADETRGLGKYKTAVSEEALRHIARMSAGDMRIAYNALELAVLTTPPAPTGEIVVTLKDAEESIQQKALSFDEQLYYDMLSAFCKSLRGGDSDAAIAWFARLIYAGIDPRIICRRLIAHASEDVGLANPQAMVQAVAAAQALEFIGMPEAGLSITQAIIFICESPKSNSVVIAKDTAFAEAKSIPDQPVPIHLRDTSYPGASKLGHGRGYKYPHDYPGHVVAQEYMPPSVKGHKYYIPGELGSEGKIRQNHINQGRIKEK